MIPEDISDVFVVHCQEYREQEAFECWLPKLSADDIKLFEWLC